MLKNKSPNPKEICRDWTSYLEGKLRRIEKDIATDETAREESRKRLKWITVDNRKIAAEELDDRKKALARAETALNEASKMCDELQAKLLDQEAFIYRKELCDFIKSRKYAIEPRQIAKALAGLPYMKSRRSAERCLSLSCSIPVMSNYRVFSFVCSRWKRRMERGDRPLVNWFKQEVISLPKWLGKGDDRQENQLRACLTQNWYFLKRAIEQVQALKHSQTPQPYFIAQQFLQNSLNPPVGTDRILADKERISE